MALIEKVIETQDGFRVEGANHEPIVVTFTPTFIRVEASPENQYWFRRDWTRLEDTRFGFYQYYDFSRHIGKCISADWQPPERDGEKHEPIWLRPWKAKKEARIIGKEVHEHWKKNLGRIDPLVLAAHKQVFVACGMHCCDLVMNPQLYQHPYIARDIGQYRAAAVAAMNVDWMAKDRAKRQVRFSPEALEIKRQLMELAAKANRHSLNIPTSLSVIEDDLDEHDLDSFGAMENWRGLFSYSGQSYKSLDRTLMNLPGNIPHGFVCKLAGWDLRRPYTERLELLAILLLPRRPRNAHVFEFASTPQIKEAIRRIAEHTHNEYSTRRCNDVKDVVKFLADYPGRHTGNIVGLADKAIVYHRDRLQAERDEKIELLGGDTQAALPPIPLPQTPGVTFLDTVGAICQEGAEMGHCVADYSDQAIAGGCFLFRVEHDDDRATVQVDWMGRVEQAHGPHNRRNGAARWGRRILRQWGRQFPEDVPMPLLQAPDDDLPF